MDIKILATGSDGNCVWISNGAISILIDCGLPKTKVEKILLAADIDPTKIEAIFVTHEHQDHARGLPFADKYKIPVYASEGTLKELGRLETGKILKSFIILDAFSTSHLSIAPFPVHHDAMEPTGFVIRDQHEKVSVLMDTGKVDDAMLYAMSHSHQYVFECNHDEDMLVNGDYPDTTKARILSDIGHLSNHAAAAALAHLVQGRGERIYLTHMSSSNNMPALAQGAVKKALRQKGLQAGKHYHLEVF